MESRKITIIMESSNNFKVIDSAATTLGELKRDLNIQGIHYGDQVFREGLSRTELIDDSSLLPRDVLFRGVVTNDLVFTLTTANKKIKSGAMSRSEVVEYIRKCNLQDSVKLKYGRNYTQVSTENLETLINKQGQVTDLPLATVAKNEVSKATAPAVEYVTKERFNRLISVLQSYDNYMDYILEDEFSSDSVGTEVCASTVSVWTLEDLKTISQGL